MKNRATGFNFSANDLSAILSAKASATAEALATAEVRGEGVVAVSG